LAAWNLICISGTK